MPAAVALMDCPGHGERRAAEITDEEFDATSRAGWPTPTTTRRCAPTGSTVERAARAADARITGTTGYAGFSMGAMFGLAIVADLPSVVAAVFALGGLTIDEKRNALIRAGARRLGEREVLMLNMTRDEHFAMPGALEVFESIPGPKRMGVWDGYARRHPARSHHPSRPVPRPHARLRPSPRALGIAEARHLAERGPAAPLAHPAPTLAEA